MSKAIQLHLADSLDFDRKSRSRRLAPRRTRRIDGENAEVHTCFESWETMAPMLSPKRLELPRHLHRNPAKSIRALAQTLRRDYRRAHEDVEALEAAGLLDRDDEGLRADYDAFEVSMRVAL